MSAKSNNVKVDGHYLLASSTAGLIARCITHPMDTIKTRLQTTTTTTATRPQSISALFKSIHTAIFQNEPTRSKSFLSLYRGLPVTLVFSVPALTVHLSCYEISKQTLDPSRYFKQDTAFNHLLSGCFAEVAAGLLFTPMEVMKNRLQTAHYSHLQSTTTTTTTTTTTIKDLMLAKSIFKKEGILGFYKGYWMGLVVFVPHSMAYFATYEKMKQYWRRNRSSHHTNHNSNDPKMFMVCSSIAGVVSILLSTPLDVIKTRWQISAAEQGKAFRSGPVQIARNMLMKEGWYAFKKGLWARMAWGIPTTAISMTLFELLK
ncbi:mitochondrial carrier domain-containing protein [Mycotypha africana]|uniref:mitochondrial carrier domain-containing protein n=1 Tax=Mycotypha africana TaxID=64632 RepID=UPI0023013269|nr:mitochondrial carrier domain-containing protein [Mycotypha africana]KAI8991692.1 mitochondrial carrier domain-containing protein [Mycotypha africana]